MEDAAAILRFWFGEHADDPETARMQAALWWSRQAAIDADIRTRFGATLDAAAAGMLDAWAETPRGLLALIVLLDQFPRSIHRGTPRAFASDARALHWAAQAVALGTDRQWRPIERVFGYLPFEHAESMAAQQRAVVLFSELPRVVPEAQRALFDGYLDYAERHRDIIARFGRFPHRNAILGRSSTEAEQAFLATPGSSF